MTYEPPILFPGFLGKPIWRQLGLIDVNQVLTESEHAYLDQSTTELAALLHAENLLVWTPDLLSLEDFHWYLENAEIFCNKRAEPTSIRLHYPRGTRWIGQTSAWGAQMPTLDILRAFFEILGVGTYHSPGATGKAFLRKTWALQFGFPYKEQIAPDEFVTISPWKAHRHQRPPEGACLEMKAKGTGARSDLLTHEQEFESLYELDQKNAYGRALARPQPTGKASRFFDGYVTEYACYVADARVTITEPLRYGLFPVREEKQDILYPTQPGVYTSWLWKEEVDLCRDYGLKVEIGDGWGWYETTTDLASFAQAMERFRDQAAPEVASLMKQTLVATIGSLGMDSERYTLTTHGIDGVDQRIGSRGRATDYFLRKEKIKRPETMPHWYWHVCMLVRVELTREVLRWIAQEDSPVVATNTDAVLVKASADVSRYPAKGAQETRDGWQVRRLHTVTIPRLRHLVATTESGETIEKRPGKKKEKKI